MNDVDPRCNETSPEMAKRKLFVMYTTYCKNCISDSCEMIEKATYDVAGKLVKLQARDLLIRKKLFENDAPQYCEYYQYE